MEIVDQEKLTRTKLIDLINNHRPVDWRFSWCLETELVSLPTVLCGLTQRVGNERAH